MNREIKFRGKNKKNGWIYGFYFINRGEHFIVQDGIVSPFNTHLDFVVEPETIGQFTGLYDRKEKEIYEGDIIRRSDNRIGVVVFINGGFMIESKIYGRCVRTPLYVFGEKSEVIGNVHDNPELLKGGEE